MKSIKTDAQKVVKKQLLDLLRGGNAHMSFDEAVSGFPIKHINKKPPNVPYSFWHLLEHMRSVQWDILEFIRNPEHVSPDWPSGYWPPENNKAGKALWEKTIKDFRADLRAVTSLVRNAKTDFYGPIPHAKDYTIFREILLVADHNAYHIGEFIILRQVMNIPPPEKW